VIKVAYTKEYDLPLSADHEHSAMKCLIDA
jgi:hypothetical protein